MFAVFELIHERMSFIGAEGQSSVRRRTVRVLHVETVAGEAVLRRNEKRCSDTQPCLNFLVLPL